MVLISRKIFWQVFMSPAIDFILTMPAWVGNVWSDDHRITRQHMKTLKWLLTVIWSVALVLRKKIYDGKTFFKTLNPCVPVLSSLVNVVIVLTDKQVTQEQILELLPWVSEVNAISEELNKYRSFDVVVLPSVNNKPAEWAEFCVLAAVWYKTV